MGLTAKGQPGGLATLNTGGRLASAQASGSQAYLNGLPTGTFRTNMNRDGVVSNLSALTTQVMLDTALYLEAGDVVTALTFTSGGTAAGTPTNWWFALYDTQATPALIGQTADQLTAAWAANTAMKLNLATPYTVPATGVYRAAVMVKATTVPTLIGSAVQTAASSAIATGQKVLASTSGSSLVATAPATVATPTAVGTVPYVIAS
jgi:hypothetical protein